MTNYRERLTANANDFDSIVSEILAETERLRDELIIRQGECADADQHLAAMTTEVVRLEGQLDKYKTELGQACVAVLQKDYSVIDDLSKVVILSFDKDNINATLPEKK